MKRKITDAEKLICKCLWQLPSDRWIALCDTPDRLNLFRAEKYWYDLLTRSVAADLSGEENPIDPKKEPPRFAYDERDENGNIVIEEELKPRSMGAWKHLCKAINLIKDDYLSLHKLIKIFWNEINRHLQKCASNQYPVQAENELIETLTPILKIEGFKIGSSSELLIPILKVESDARMTCLFPELATGNFYAEFSLRNYERKKDGAYYNPYRSKLRQLCVQAAKDSIENQTLDSMEAKKSDIALRNYHTAHEKLLKQHRSSLRGRKSFAVNHGVVVPSKKGGVYGA